MSYEDYLSVTCRSQDWEKIGPDGILHNEETSLRSTRDALAVPFISGIVPTAEYTVLENRKGSDSYVFNDTRTFYDHESLVRTAPKHYPAIDGLRTEVNLLTSALAITTASNWTVDAGVTLTYEGNGWFRVQNISAGAGDAVISPVALSGVSITNNEILGSLEIYNADATNSGIKVYTKRSGGTFAVSDAADTTITATTAANPDVLATGIMTGGATSTGATLVLGQDPTSTPSDDFYFRFPTLVNVTGRTNQNPPDPIPVDTAVGVQIIKNNSFDDGSTHWDVQNEDGTHTVTISGGSARYVSDTTSPVLTLVTSGYSPMVAGRKYIAITTGTVVSGGLKDSGSNTNLLTATGTQIAVITAAGSGLAFIRTTTNVDVTIDSIELYEATLGIQQFDDTNQNRVLGDGTVETDGDLKWVDLDGVSGTLVTSPDSAAADITGDITIIACIAATDWTPAAYYGVVSKFLTPNDSSYRLALNTDGTLVFQWSPDGTTGGILQMSSNVLGYADGSRHWVRVTFDVDDESGNRVGTFYESDNPPDQFPAESDWTAIGSTTTAGTTSIFSGTARLEVGSDIGGGNVFVGDIYSARVIASTDPTATPSVSFNAADHTGGNTITSSETGEVWTLHSNAKINYQPALPLHPTHWERIKVDRGTTVLVERKDPYDPFALSTAYSLGQRYIHADWATNYNHGLYSKVAAFPNLLPPAARIPLTANGWTQTGTGTETDNTTYVTLNDTDATAEEAEWQYDVAIPTDNAAYRLSITMSQGTAAATSVILRPRGISTNSNWYTYTWATGVLVEELAQSAGVSGVIVDNGDGTVTLAITATDDAANNSMRLVIFAATNDASATGSVNVHGEVILQRVSIAAEPTTNTLRPGDSVTQLVLQQSDPNTTWQLANTPVIGTGVADPRGGTNGFSIEDNNVSGSEGIKTPELAMSIGQKMVAQVWVPKVSTVDVYGFISFNDGTTTYGAVFDPINGAIKASTNSPDFMQIIDGASLDVAALYPDKDDFWLLRIGHTLDSGTGFVLTLLAGHSETFTSTYATAAQGTAYYAEPSAYIVESFSDMFFTDTLATTTTVTETIADWSKIITPVADATNNVANLILSHGHYTNRGIAILPAATNSLTYSQDFSNAAWTKTASTAGANYGVAPDGTFTSFSLTDNVTDSSHDFRRDVTTTAVAWTFSVYAKAGTNDWMKLYNGINISYFNLATGALGTINSSGATIEPLGDGWYRCSITDTMTAASNRHLVGSTPADNTPNYAGSTTVALEVWGAQLETGIVATPYIPTVASTVTRTTMAGAVRYSDANHSDDSMLYLARFSLGVAQASVAAVQNIYTSHAASGNRGMYFHTNGDFKVFDNTTTSTISDWSEPANSVISGAVALSSAAGLKSINVKTPNKAITEDATSYDGSMNGDGIAIYIGGTSLAYPMHVYELIAIRNGYVASIGTLLDSDTDRYAE